MARPGDGGTWASASNGMVERPSARDAILAICDEFKDIGVTRVRRGLGVRQIGELKMELGLALIAGPFRMA